jgi:hypothetical protein
MFARSVTLSYESDSGRGVTSLGLGFHLTPPADLINTCASIPFIFPYQSSCVAHTPILRYQEFCSPIITLPRLAVSNLEMKPWKHRMASLELRNYAGTREVQS